MNRRFTYSAIIVLYLLMTTAVVLAKPPGPDSRTVRVDCARGDSISKVLKLPAHRLVIEVSGVCTGDLRIDRDRVTLLGLGSDAALYGDAETPGPVVEISGARGINLVNLRVAGGDSSGVVVQRNGEARLERVNLIDTPLIGLFLEQGASVLLVDSSSSGHQLFGAALFGNSGLTVRGSNEFSNNGQVGLLMSDGSGLHTQGIGTITASDNGAVGLVLQAGASGLFPSVVAERNGVAGLQLVFTASFSSIGNENSFSNNGLFGAFLFDNAQLSVAGEIRDNAVAGILASEDSVVSVATDIPSQLTGSPVDVILDGAIGTFNTVDIGSVELTFGTRVTFGPDATVANLFCDSTVLSRGSVSCPPVTSTIEAPEASDQLSVAGEWSGLRRLYQKPWLQSSPSPDL